MEPFATLGLNPNAPPDVVKMAYKRLAREHHPDKGGSVEKFQAVQEAYEAICNMSVSRNNFTTIFDDMVNLVPKRRVRVEIKLTLEELYIGKCLLIQGVRVELPPGIIPFQIIVIPELNDYQLLVTIAKHPFYTIDFVTKNLIFKTSISLCEALVGYRGKIKHPNGKMMYLSTPENVVVGNESVFHFKGGGVPMGENGSSSDLVVAFDVIMPKTIDSVKHREALLDIFDCNVPVIAKKNDDVIVELKI
jgi:DnaJ-class molecular chaperone